MVSEYRFREKVIQYPSHPLNEAMVREILNGETYPLSYLGGYQPSVIVDIGSNVGSSLIYFHHHFPKSKIYGFEPSHTNLEWSLQNTQGIDSLKIFPYGLSDQDSEMPLYQGFQTGSQHSLYPRVTTCSQVEMVSIRDARNVFEELELTHICLLKIDTEGSEISILSRIFSEGSPIAVAHLFVEYHSIEEKDAIDTFLETSYEKEEVSSYDIPCYFPDGRIGTPLRTGVTFYRLRALRSEF